MSRATQILQAAQVLRARRGRRAALHWKPFSVTSFRVAAALEADGLRFRTIIDGGANAGQFARAAVETFPDARVIAFEPLPDVAARLRANLAGCARVSVHEAALGSRDGNVEFHRNAYSLASSALRLRPDARESFPQVVETASFEVEIGRVDSFLDEDPLEGPVLLKLDLQGYELEALRGAPRTLERTDYVLVETSFTPTYEDEPRFDDIHGFLQEAGFRLRRPVSVLKDATGRIAEMDVLFERNAV